MLFWLGCVGHCCTGRLNEEPVANAVWRSRRLSDVLDVLLMINEDPGVA